MSVIVLESIANWRLAHCGADARGDGDGRAIFRRW